MDDLTLFVVFVFGPAMLAAGGGVVALYAMISLVRVVRQILATGN